jgi:hypothetical protein
MKLRADDRALAVQVGVTILLGFVVIAIATYQVQVVPQQNRGAELDHSREVRAQMGEVRNAIASVPGGGSGRSVSVPLGTNYPPRTVFLNPPPPSGSLATTDLGTLSIRNASADGEVGDFWNGSTRTLSTRALVYRPDYARFQTAPTTVYENTVVYGQFADSVVPGSEQRLVDDSTVTLVALNGTYQAASSSAVSVDLRATSTSTRTVTVSNRSGLTLELPTRLDNETWADLLAEERVANGGNVSGIEVVGSGDARTLRIDLAPGSYDLRMARVGVGTGVAAKQTAYLAAPEGTEATTTVDGRVRLVVEVRDQFNNPVSGRTVRAPNRSSGLDLLDAPTKRTDSEGQAAFVYRATAAGDYGVTVNTSTNASAAERVHFEVGAVSTGSGGGGGGNAFAVNFSQASGEFSGCDPVESCEFEAALPAAGTLTLETTPPADGARVDAAVNNTSVATVSPTSATTAADGTSTLTFNATTAGTVAVYASGGGSGDVVNVTVTDSSSPGRPAGKAYADADDDGEYDAGETTYTIDTLKGGFDRDVNLVIPGDVGGGEVRKNGDLSIKARQITAAVAFRANNVKLLATKRSDSSLDIRNVSITATGGGVTLKAGGEAGVVLAHGLVVNATDSLEISQTNQIRAANSEISAKSLDLLADKGSNGSVVIEGGRIDTTGGGMTIKTTNNGGVISADELLIDSQGDVSISQTSRIELADAEVTTQGGKVSLKASKSPTTRDSVIDARGVNITTSSGAIEFSTKGSAVYVNDSTTEAVLDASDGDKKISVKFQGSNTQTLYVAGVEIRGKKDEIKVSGADSVSGDPESGSVK